MTAQAAISFERVTTTDGAVLTLKRRSCPGGVPVLFVHGISVNADLWDLPPVTTRHFQFESLATRLARQGYDVWLLNLRGHGSPHMLSAPPPGQNDWCVDHFLLYDVPAAVAHVGSVTGQRPWAIANSMGAMSTVGSLLGARLVRRVDGDHGERILLDDELAAVRQGDLAGLVTVEFPAVLRWPHSYFDTAGRFRWDRLLEERWPAPGASNVLFEVLSRWRWLELSLAAAGQVPTGWFRPNGPPWWGQAPAPVAVPAEWMAMRLTQFVLNAAGLFTGATQHRAEVFLRGRRFVTDHMKAGVLRQLAKCVRLRTFCSALGAPDCVYADHYDRIVLPVLTLAGGRDRIANAASMRVAFFDRVSSRDKTWRQFEEFAHGEFEAAPEACTQVYPVIEQWLAARK